MTSPLGSTSLPPPAGAATCTVLVVCTANRFRSPIAEQYLARALQTDRPAWRVHSAGSAAVPGEPMEPRTSALLAAEGYDVTDWRTHRLDTGAVASADLILAAAATHRARVAECDPPAVRRTFLLLEFARLAAAARRQFGPLPSEAGLDELLAAVARARTTTQPVPPGADDLADPVGRPDRVLRACAARIATAVSDIVAPLGPSPG